VQRSGDLLPGYTCHGVNYQPTERVLAGNRVVYTTKESQQLPPAPDDANAGGLHKAHGAWHNMLRVVFVDSPRELQRSAHARRALRRLRHRAALK
jgi:hypothetical protein